MAKKNEMLTLENIKVRRRARLKLKRLAIKEGSIANVVDRLLDLKPISTDNR